VLVFIVGASSWLELLLRTRVLRRWRRLLLTLLLASVPFVLWDVLAVHLGHWSFDPDAVLSLRLGGLPLEEWLFFPVVGFAAILTLEAVRSVRGRPMGDEES